MSLENDSPAVLITRSGRLAEYDVAGIIPENLNAPGLAPVKEILLHLLLVLGRARNSGQSIEIVPDDFRFEIFDCHNFSILCYCFDFNGKVLSMPS